MFQNENYNSQIGNQKFYFSSIFITLKIYSV